MWKSSFISIMICSLRHHGLSPFKKRWKVSQFYLRSLSLYHKRAEVRTWSRTLCPCSRAFYCCQGIFTITPNKSCAVVTKSILNEAMRFKVLFWIIPKTLSFVRRHCNTRHFLFVDPTWHFTSKNQVTRSKVHCVSMGDISVAALLREHIFFFRFL